MKVSWSSSTAQRRLQVSNFPYFSAPEMILLKDSGVMIPVVGGSFLTFMMNDEGESHVKKKNLEVKLLVRALLVYG